MTGLALAWRFRFPLAVLLIVLVGALGIKAYAWKSNQLAAERALVSSYKAERDQANKDREKQSAVLTEREARNAKLQNENNLLRRQLRGALDTPQGRAWAATPLPLGLALRLSAADTAADSAAAVGPDAPADLRGDDERRPP